MDVFIDRMGYKQGKTVFWWKNILVYLTCTVVLLGPPRHHTVLVLYSTLNALLQQHSWCLCCRCCCRWRVVQSHSMNGIPSLCPCCQTGSLISEAMMSGDGPSVCVFLNTLQGSSLIKFGSPVLSLCHADYPLGLEASLGVGWWRRPRATQLEALLSRASLLL